MKKTVLIYAFVLALVAFGQTVWAQNPITVTTEAELIAAVQTNGANIQFANPISTTSLLEIKDSKTITIDLNSFTLNRGCTSRGSQVIVVRNGSTLNLSNGTLTGGWGRNGGAFDIETNTTVNLTDVIITGNHADDRGGGISNKGTLTITRGAFTNNTSYDIEEGKRGGGGLFNYEGATATLTNVTFNGNKATVTGGGGICNYGTITLDGCTITGNSCKMNGGGIWQGADATLNLLGQITVTGNTSDGDETNNLFLKTNAVITVTGSLAGSSIGVLMENSTGTFTSGFGTYNSGVDPATLFFSDLPEAFQVAAAESEAKVDVLTSFQYIECSWDDVNKQVVKTPKTLSNCIPLGSVPSSEADYKVITGGSGEFGMGGRTNDLPEFFVVRGTVNRDALRVNGNNVHLVLCDGARLNVNSIIVNPAYKLYIHVQSYGSSMGKLNADNNGHEETAAGIGSESGLSHDPYKDGPGLIEIHGGTIYAKGGDNAAGIGGGDWAKGGNIVIYGGDIRAYGGDGGGVDGSGGAGIGGGNLAEGPINFTVYDGSVYAEGGPDAAGIGSGNCGNNFDYTIHHGGYFTMYGGYVEAHGADNAAGIGGGEWSEGPRGANIYGGTVKAYGGEDAAGIGSGYHFDTQLSSGTIHISGGEVYAWGKDEGAGIGGGENAKGADVTITGGIVEAHAGENETGYKAIGPGRDNSNYGTLNLGDQMMVRYKIGNDWSEPVPANYPTYGRKAGAWYHTEARIEPCTHPNATYTVSGTTATDTHTEHCLYCTTPFEPELHHFENENEPCTVCHVNGSINSVSVYLPDIDGEGHYTDGDYQDTPVVYNMVTNSTFVFPATPLDPQGMDFAGWRDGDTTGLNTFIAGESEALHETGSSFTISEDVIFTSRFHKINLFNKAGNWNEANNWYWEEVPVSGSDVVIGADAIIPNEYTAIADSIAIDGGSLTIADGGQLIHNKAGVTATVQKEITGHGGNNNGGWNFIASPMVTDIIPATTNGFLTEDYDLYYYDEPTHYWRNFKPDGLYHGFDIEPQKGYLYASQATTTLNMTGTLQPSNDPVTISSLSHEASVLNGFNLVGNPFACNATIDRPFYVIEGKHVVAYEGSEPIAPATGVMVQADANHESVTFTRVTPEAQASQPNNGSLQIALSQVTSSLRGTKQSSSLDNAIVSFREGSRLEKFHFGNDAKVYIPQGGKDYAIAFSEGQGEMPLNFKATENGEYTISVNPEGVEMNYLHLIDNMTGTDIDLLVQSSYTFDARTTDYESRFRLVFASVNEDTDGDNEAFAFYSNGNWFIANEGRATLQVIDVTGRVLSSESINGYCSKAINAAQGIYMLRLVNGDNVKVQKIVVR